MHIRARDRGWVAQYLRTGPALAPPSCRSSLHSSGRAQSPTILAERAARGSAPDEDRPRMRIGPAGGWGRISNPIRRLDRETRGLERLLTADELGERLGMKTEWVWAQARAGRIPHVRLDWYRRFRESAVEEWLRDIETRGSGPSRAPDPVRSRCVGARGSVHRRRPDDHVRRSLSVGPAPRQRECHGQVRTRLTHVRRQIAHFIRRGGPPGP
jgi:hypothetical protein